MSKDGICSFGNVQERDMDLMFMESLLTDDGFVWLFLNKAGIACNSVEVLNVALSETDPEYGESDITAILSIDGKKHALLIEDKINAPAHVTTSVQIRRKARENMTITPCLLFARKHITMQIQKRRNTHTSLHTKIA